MKSYKIQKDIFLYFPLFFGLLLFITSLFFGPAKINFSYVVLLFVFLFYLYNKNTNINFKLSSENILQALFCLYLILNSYLFNYNDITSIKSLFFFRFFLIAYIVSKLISINYKVINFFSLIVSTVSIFLCLDIFYQYLTGYDIFGYQAGICSYPGGTNHLDPKNCERFSGFFGDEYIAGNFLTTYGVFFTYLFIKNTNFNPKIKFMFFSVIFFVISMGVILSGERNALLMLIIIFFWNLFFNKSLRKFILYICLIFILMFIISINNFENVKYRYYDWPKNHITSQEGNNFEKLIYTAWGRHFITAYEIFIQNPYLGTGLKSFRYECGKKKYSFDILNQKYNLSLDYKKGMGCSTHPHNFYFEILAELGIFGFITFVYIIYLIIFKNYFRNKNLLKDKTTTIFIMSVIISILFPFRPTGSFSSTVYMTNLWFFIGFYLYFVKETENNK